MIKCAICAKKLDIWFPENGINKCDKCHIAGAK